jgi:hypothetical protein
VLLFVNPKLIIKFLILPYHALDAYFNQYKYFFNLHIECPTIVTYSIKCFVTTRTILLDQVSIYAIGKNAVLLDVEIHAV